MSGNVEETLRLQFGTAANTIGTQWYDLQHTNNSQDGLLRSDGKPRLIAFEAKGRIQRQLVASKRPRAAQEEQQRTWNGNVQVYDQSEPLPSVDNGLWNWYHCNDKHLFEVDEFRPHMPLHNFYEGYPTSHDGSVRPTTFDAAEDRLRSVLEDCDSLRMVQCLIDMDSSWSGFAYQLLTYMNEECPSAVVSVFGNDWSYPLDDSTSENLFGAAPEVRDKAKAAARRRINVASSLALLSEVSSLLVPIAMSPASLLSSQFSNVAFNRSNCGNVGALVAIAIESAISAYRGRSVYEIVEGIVPSKKMMELAASYPYSGNPIDLLKTISDENAIKHAHDDPFRTYSLLPAIPQARSARSNSTSLVEYKVTYRRLHFHGSFADYPSLQSFINRIEPSTMSVQWSNDPLIIPPSFHLQDLAGSSIDTVSQLSLSSRMGEYLDNTATQLRSSDKRVLYEFTRAGMNIDALEELETTLQASRDAYYE